MVRKKVYLRSIKKLVIAPADPKVLLNKRTELNWYENVTIGTNLFWTVSNENYLK